MKIFRISKINSDTINNLHSLLKTMDSKTHIEMDPGKISGTWNFVTGGVLKVNGNGIYGSSKLTRGNKSLLEEPSLVRINNKEYLIDNFTGEIKPKKFSLITKIFGLKKKLIDDISSIINKVHENFENSNIVKQHQWSVLFFTEEGAQKIDAAQISSKKILQRSKKQS